MASATKASQTALQTLLEAVCEAPLKVDMKKLTIWEFLAGYGYKTDDLARFLKVPVTNVELWMNHGWGVPSDLLSKLQNLRQELIERRYG